MLAHYRNLSPTAGTPIYEPLYGNLFEITFEVPSLTKIKNDSTETLMLMLNAGNIKLDLTKDLTVHQQYFKYSGRQYLNTKKDNSIIGTQDLSITFNINVSDKFAITTWNILKKWYDLAWNSQTGELHYKKNMTGKVVAHIHDREGVVVRRVEFINVQIVGISEMDFKWSEENILSTTAKFIADYWIDQYFDM